jgi:GH15 family glucan-1,4-alpha-glucosidase
MFGLFDLDSAEVIASFKTIEQTFRVTNQDVLPLPRYEHDQYNRVEQDSLGNPWFICTLWQAQYYLETNRAADARKILDWVQAQMLKSGVLSEQVNPYTHAFLSVAPLAWSQAEFINTAIDLLNEPMKEIKAAESLERS